ncbi:xanthine dehydrogenase family protein molybdopterin-binding subunit [Coralloluteibacterium stylophorae]|uniref:Xanthine dehydrogenase family protein molybdopterin-binding subunit n=1 Tax=Coralloluteibacterium stylophorae TaxID=1776034 RepID=A0A8J7VTR9_9GAMM|nr:xanthine dehydrogenase family protein molybdopterin-binding subunit [Coralloluteibacterium stylophorae]MBS7456981.1 xanthine dehydrogenase family protein molybdopterin-binding subunit [Coralloluteibacterium stylophorae]
MTPIRPDGVIGRDHARVDGIDKVTGRARYGADEPVAGTAFACLATAAIARGRILDIDDRAARRVRGVLVILTHRNVGDAIRPGTWMLDKGHMATAIAPLASDAVHFAGQIVAVAVAESFEAAREAAALLRFEYRSEPHAATFGSPGAEEVEPRAMGETALAAGEPEAALAAAPVRIDTEYATPAQHHNPLELFQATCAWDGDTLTVWESSQNVRGYQHGLARQLGLRPKQVRVVSQVVGGAFGSRGELGQATAIVALAARRLRRPVKLVASRRDAFTIRSFRAETRHRVQLAAARDGRLLALCHDSRELGSRSEHFALAGSDSTARLYACPNVRTGVRGVAADRQTPGFMRAPPETPYLFALECAMDELAWALDIDPLELRRRNDTMVDPVHQLPYTSRSLVRCIDAGAAEFGWARRDPRPGSMREGEEVVGFGYATAFYPTQVGPADCRVALAPDLRARVEVGTHEIGTGIRTVIAQTVADRLGIAIEAVEVAIGDSDLPAAPLSAGSSSTASVCSAVALACEALRARIGKAATAARNAPLHGLEPAALRLGDGRVHIGDASEPLAEAVRRACRGRPMVEKATHTPHGAPPVIGPVLVRRGLPVIAGGSMLRDRLQFAFGAQFVEVRIDRATGRIRIPRMTGAFAAGRIVNPRTARSQLMGGQVWGASAALWEATEIDPRSGRYANCDLAEYLLPTHADIGRVDTLMLDEEDTRVNPLGIKGVGELGVTGMNAAVANAVFHATGLRVRTLPIRLDALLAAPALAGA